MGGHSGSSHRGYRYRDPYWSGYYYWGGSYYYWGGSRPRSRFDRLNSGRRWYADDEQKSGRDTRGFFFFPPVPPPLGVPLPPPAPEELERETAPADLSAYIYEPFYTPLATRLLSRDLTTKLLHRLEAYRSTRSALLDELRSMIAEVRDGDPSVQIERLEALSVLQGPRIQELETEGEQLRVDLLRNGLVGVVWGSGDWNQDRPWKLGVDTLNGYRDQILPYEFRVMRAAVFFQEGLSGAQRRFLREIAMELQVEAFRPKDSTTVAPETWVSFQPETSRIQIPDNIAPELGAKLAVFEEEKDALKEELRAELFRLDSTTPVARSEALRRLADKQGSRISGLEVLAEDIRRGLSAYPNLFGPPSAPAFPPELSARISDYRRSKLELQKALQHKIEETRQTLGPGLMTTRRRESTEANDVLSIDASSTYASQEQVQSVREAVAQFNREYSEKFATLTRQQQQLREEVARWASTNSERRSDKSVDDLIKDFDQARKRQDAWPHYSDYQDAVLLPGLSPGQRRLLFGGALEKLALPLPAGENVPW